MKKRKQRLINKTRTLYADPGVTMDWLGSGISGTYQTPHVRSWTPEFSRRKLRADYEIGKADRRSAYGTDPHWPLGTEQIAYTTGNLTGMNNCVHLKQQMCQYPVTAYRYYSDTFHYFEVYKRWDLRLGFWKDALSTALSAELDLPGFSDQQFSARAYWSMRPKFQSEVSLINSIFELKDFKDVLPGLLHGFRSIGKLIGPTLYAKKQIGKSLSVLASPISALTNHGTKAASAAVLTWNLAVMPTVRDVVSIHAAAQKDVHQLAKQFVEFGEEGSRTHYSEQETYSRLMIRRLKGHFGIADGSTVDYRRTATAHFYYRLLWERFEDMYPRWWGLEIGADEVWNMLPLSFVFDYVFTIGKSLEYMDRENRISVQGVNYCESIKIVASMGTYVLNDSYVPALMIDGKYIPRSQKTEPLLVTGTVGTVYRRKVMDPYCGPALPTFKLPSAKQGLNMLALARCMLF